MYIDILFDNFGNKVLRKRRSSQGWRAKLIWIRYLIETYVCNCQHMISTDVTNLAKSSSCIFLKWYCIFLIYVLSDTICSIHWKELGVFDRKGIPRVLPWEDCVGVILPFYVHQHHLIMKLYLSIWWKFSLVMSDNIEA